MNKWLTNKKLIAISVVVLAVLLLAAVYGSRAVVSYYFSYYFKKGTEEFRQNDFAAAKEQFLLAVHWNPKDPLSHVYLGKISLGLPASKSDNYYPQANYEEAAKHFEEALSRGLDEANARFYSQTLDDIGFSYWSAKQYDKAVERYLEKIEKYPQSSFWARYFVAHDYFDRSNKPEEALDLILAAPNMAASENDRWNLFRFYALISRLYGYFKDVENGEKYAHMAIQSTFEGNRDSDIQIAHVFLALAAGVKKDFVTAEAEIKKANELAGSANLNDCSLANAYYVGGNYLKASQIAAQQKQTGYLKSICLRVLAESYLALNNKTEAAKYMQEYLALTDSFKEKNLFTIRDRERIRKELENIK